MKTIYQIVAKGMATNRICMYEFDNFKDYQKNYELLLKNELFTIITTNQFIIS